MIKIHHLNGYKYIGDNPRNRRELLRDNLTYMSFEMTNFEKDIKSFQFICKYHLSILDDNDIYNLLKPLVKDNKVKKVSLIIKQSEETNGDIAFVLSSSKASKIKEIDSFIKSKEEFYNL